MKQTTKDARAATEGAVKKLGRKKYEKELARLQGELVRLQEWVVGEGLKVCVVFEGRDTAGKGGAIRYFVFCASHR
jgi:polyphosphate kinase 2 (PPK2 family)